MPHDSIALMKTLLEQSGTSSTPDLVPISPPSVPIVTDWKTAYYDALKSWKPVIENGRHDHSPMPMPGTITSFQVGLIQKAAKPAPKRLPRTPPYTHKACVEAWTVPHDQIVRHKSATQWRKFAQLRIETGFEKVVKDAASKGHITPDFRDWSLAIVGRQGKPDDMWGIFHDNNGGWHYYDEHLVRVEMTDPKEPVVHLWRDRSYLTAMKLTTEFAGNPLPDGGIQTHTQRENYGE